MRIGVLGPLVLHRPDGEVVVRRRGHRTLLCRLALAHGRTVPTDQLVIAMWGESQPAAARKSVQVYVSELRRLLGEDRGVLASDGSGYRLDVSDDQVDAVRFEHEVAVGVQALANDAPVRSTTTLRGALARWRGPAFADVRDLSWATAAATRLDELRITALERLMDAELAAGRHAELVPELVDLVHQHPYMEGLRAQLMVALFRCGRQSEALAVHRDGAAVVAEELGVDPAPSLVELERRILQQDPSLLDPTTGGRGVDVGQTPATRSARSRTDGDSPGAANTSPGWTPERRWVAALVLTVGAGVQSSGGHATTAIDELGGTVLSVAGGRVVAVFGAPVSHEDDVVRAVAAARRVTAEAGNGHRAAVACGEVIAGVRGGAGERRFVAEGDAVDLATQLHRHTDPGTLLLDATARDALGDRADVVGVTATDGMRAWRLDRLRTAARGGPDRERTGFVGRRTELQLVNALWQIVVSQSSPHLISVIGDAGVGKSRLVSEWVSTLTETTVLVGRSRPWGDVPFGPLAEVVRQGVALDGDVSVGVAREALERWLADHHVDDVASVTGRLLVLLGLGTGLVDPDQQDVEDQRQVFTAVAAFLRGQAATTRTVVVVEDLHWAGSSVIDLIAWLTSELHDAPLAIVATARPELLDRHRSWQRIVGRTTTIVLDELSPSEADELAVHCMHAEGAGSDPRAAGRRTRAAVRLRTVAGGNPLYLEQLALWAAESSDPLPPSIRSLLTARLDQLGAWEREVLQAAAVVGREGEVSLVDVLVAPHAAGPLLETLVARRVLSGTGRPDRFAFRHELLAEAALRTVPADRRRELHRTLAAHLEQRPPASRRTTLLAHHWLSAGDAARAMPHLVAAADEAARAWAYHDAAGLYDKAVTLLEGQDPLLVDDELLRSLRLQRGTAALRWMHRVLDWYELGDTSSTDR